MIDQSGSAFNSHIKQGTRFQGRDFGRARVLAHPHNRVIFFQRAPIFFAGWRVSHTLLTTFRPEHPPGVVKPPALLLDSEFPNSLFEVSQSHTAYERYFHSYRHKLSGIISNSLPDAEKISRDESFPIPDGIPSNFSLLLSIYSCRNEDNLQRADGNEVRKLFAKFKTTNFCHTSAEEKNRHNRPFTSD